MRISICAAGRSARHNPPIDMHKMYSTFCLPAISSKLVKAILALAFGIGIGWFLFVENESSSPKSNDTYWFQENMMTGYPKLYGNDGKYLAWGQSAYRVIILIDSGQTSSVRSNGFISGKDRVTVKLGGNNSDVFATLFMTESVRDHIFIFASDGRNLVLPITSSVDLQKAFENFHRRKSINVFIREVLSYGDAESAERFLKIAKSHD